MWGFEECAVRYRRHADQLRVMASDPHHPDTVEKLFNLAHDYERMAEDLEKARADEALEWWPQ
jgi:hypothetical protein